MNKVKFLVATYNEENEILDLLSSISPIANYITVSDDGSTDSTIALIEKNKDIKVPLKVIRNSHSGLPETVKARGLEHIIDQFGLYPWVLMLDADERIDNSTKESILEFVSDKSSRNFTHVWFDLVEFMDGNLTRTFLKCRLFRAGFAKFSKSVHEDDRFDGQGQNFHWRVIHRKTSDKQKMREAEYLKTYQRLLDEGKVTQEWVDRCKSFHYFIK